MYVKPWTTTTRIVAVALYATLTACAGTAAPTADARVTYNDCFFARGLRDWRPLDNQHLLLFSAGRVPYLVELFRPASSLAYDVTIGIYDRDGRVCPYGGDAIIVGGPMPERVPIRSMQRLTDDQLDETYVQYGIRPPVVVETDEVEPDAKTK